MNVPQGTISVGIDVQIRRPLAIAAIDEDRHVVASFWAEAGTTPMACRVLEGLEDRGISQESIVIGIDAPNRPLRRKRPFYWDSKRGGWRARRDDERGWGRHAEVVISSCGLANPQWTPTVAESPRWMNAGYSLFAAFARRGIKTHEVFPSAAYRQFATHGSPEITFGLDAFAPSPKDMLDACVAALTVREFEAGRGCAVGDDGLGKIILPRPLPDDTPPELLRWPADSSGGGSSLRGSGNPCLEQRADAIQ